MHTEACTDYAPEVWLAASHRTVIALCAAILAVSLVLPTDHVEDGVCLPIVGVRLPSTCVMQRVTHTGCPACGLTRGFVLSAHGHWARATALQPLAVPLFLLCVLQIPLRLMLLRRTDWSIWFHRRERWAWVVLSVVVLGTWAVRLGHELLWPLLH